MPNAEQFAERVFQSVLGTLESFSIYIGDRLGLYEALRDAPSSTPAALAAATGCNERYVREWLEHQAVSGIIEVQDADDPSQRRYSLGEGAAEVLAQPDSLNYMAAVVRMAVSTAAPLPELLQAFRSGGGVPWSSYGADAREGQADINKPIFLQLIGDWFASVPALHQRLSSGNARIADVGCGGGWSSIAMARAYPGVQVDGIDVDAPSIELAKANTKGTGRRRPRLVHRRRRRRSASARGPPHLPRRGSASPSLCSTSRRVPTRRSSKCARASPAHHSPTRPPLLKVRSRARSTRMPPR